MIELQALIAEAVALGGGNLCASGHDWASQGGRSCPHDGTPKGCVNASQTVYQCSRCFTWDYGEPGGPGHHDCKRACGTTLEMLPGYDPDDPIYTCSSPGFDAKPSGPADSEAADADAARISNIQQTTCETPT